MENYIVIDGKTTNLTKEQAEKIKESFLKRDIKLADVAVGEIVKIGDHEMIVLDQSDGTTALICKDLIKTCKFGVSNNYDGSEVDKLCNEFATQLAKVIGEDNMILHTVDLTTDDGLKDFGSVTRYASLMTTELYRRYVYTLDNHKPKSWWWLATAFSTTPHDEDNWVKCVSPSGYFNARGYCCRSNGVRPFCILKSNIFVSN